MQKIKTLDEIQNMQSSRLRDHIEQKALQLLDDYEENSLKNIGCFIILNAEEYTQFLIEEMEFVEVFIWENETYLHGVRIVSDGYGEDVYLSIERIE